MSCGDPHDTDCREVLAEVYFYLDLESTDERRDLIANNIDVAKVMDVLRHMAWKEGKTNYAMASFWQSFLTTVRHFGRTYELGVMAMFMARTGRFFTDVDLAPRILPKQKLPFKPHTIVGKDAVARIFKRFDEQRSAEGDK